MHHCKFLRRFHVIFNIIETWKKRVKEKSVKELSGQKRSMQFNTKQKQYSHKGQL